MYPPQPGYPSQPQPGYPYQPPPPGGMYQSPQGVMYQPPPGGMYQPSPGAAYPPNQGVMYQPPPGGAYLPPVGGVYQPPPDAMYQQLPPGAAYPLQPGVMYQLPAGAAVRPQAGGMPGSAWIPNHEQIPNAHVVVASNWATTKVVPMDVTTAPDPNGGIQTGRWTNGLCDCCNVCVPNCLMSTCCPCVALAQVYARVGITTYRNALGRVSLAAFPLIILRLMRPSTSQDESGLGQTVVLLVIMILEGIFSLFVCYARVRVRRRFSIDGNCCEDCCVSAWCTCCAIAQMATHSRSYHPGDCSFSGPDVLPPYPV